MHRVACLVAGGLISGTACSFAQELPAPVSDAVRMEQVLGVQTRAAVLHFPGAEPGSPPIVLLSGSGSTMEDWGSFPVRLAEFAPVMLYDRPGIGGSELLSGQDLDPPVVIRHLRGLMRVVGLEPPFVLVGHSWGGVIARHYGTEHPDEVAGLVFLDSPIGATGPEHILGTSDPSELARRRAAVDSIQKPALASAAPGPQAEGRALIRYMDASPEERAPIREPDVPAASVISLKNPPSTFPHQDEEFLEGFMKRKVEWYQAWVRASDARSLVSLSGVGHFVHREAEGMSVAAVVSVINEVR